MQTYSISDYRAKSGWLIGSQSYLSDRAVPSCEQIYLPEKIVKGGTLSYGFGALPRPAENGGWLRRFKRKSVKSVSVPHGKVIDLRRNSPGNWAHLLTNHMPITFELMHRLEVKQNEVVLLLPKQIPGYILTLLETFGFQCLATDHVLEGEGIVYQAEPWTGIRSERHQWVQTPIVDKVLSRLERKANTLPEKVFLSRQDSRLLENEAEIEARLHQDGFIKVYPETLSPAEQVLMFRQAKEMVAVHGAGLGPLLYARGGQLETLVEILPCGHMTDVFRVISSQNDINWIGVRGKIKAQYIPECYDFDKPFTRYSLDSFQLDVTALNMALETSRSGNRHV